MKHSNAYIAAFLTQLVLTSILCPFCFSADATQMGRKPESSRRRTPSFFKVMFGNFSRRLGIPPAFVKHFDGVLHQEFVLRTHIGRVSRVNIKKVEKKIFFKKGWRLFVQDNSIEFGDFLVFNYDGDFEFNVTIFKRRTGCEDEVMIEGTEKRRKVIYADDSDTTNDETGMSGPHDRFRSKDFRKDEFNHQPLDEEAEVKCMKQTFSSPNIMKSMQGKTGAIEATDKFTSTLPFFKVVMRPSYIRTSYMNIPADFVNQYRNKIVPATILQVSNRSWHMKVMENCPGVRLTEGWSAFARDNALQEGDVCVFELINENKAVLKVSIFGCID